MAAGWAVMLGDVYIDCGEDPPECLGSEVRSLGFLTAPPEGLGVPELRTEDITYPQRDGVRMFSDWYNPRQITINVSVTEADVPCGADGTPCLTVREAVARIMHAWSRHCDNTELVIFTDCTGNGELVPVQTTRNLFTNPSGEAGIGGWTAINGGNTPVQVEAADAPDGSYVIRVGSADGTTDVPATVDLVPMMPVAGVYTITVTGLRSTPGFIPGIEVSGAGVDGPHVAYTSGNPDQWHDLTLTYNWDGEGSAALYPRVNPDAMPEPEPPVQLAVNYETNPSFELDVAGWTTNAGSTQPVVSTERASVGGQSLFVERGAGTASAYASHRIDGILLPGAGEYTLITRAWVPSTYDTGQNHILRVGGTGVEGPTGAFVDVQVVGYDDWIPVAIPFTWDPASGGAWLYPRSSQPSQAAGMFLDAIRIAPGTITAEDYFDGDTADTAELDYRWAGTPHASRSELWTVELPGVPYEIDADAVILVQGNDPVPYFDGNTPDEAMVLYTWDGTPGLSSSARTTYAVDNALVGPYGVVGRPRQAQLTWNAVNGYAADITLRFDAVDQNLYVLDECGNPESGYHTVELGPGTTSTCAQFPLCFGEMVMETLTFDYEVRSFTDDVGATHVQFWITDGIFPKGNYTQTTTGFGLPWSGVEGTWDTIEPTDVEWDDLKGELNPSLQFPEDKVAPPEIMLGDGILGTPGGDFTWDLRGPHEIAVDISGTGSLTGTPENPEVISAGTVTYERSTGETTGGTTFCFDQETGEDGEDAIAVVTGTECASPVIELCGKLTNPIIENVTTGQSLRYRGTIRAGDPCVIIDTTDGTATQGDRPRTNLLTGDTRMYLTPGDNELRLVSFSTTDDGYATVTWRNSVISA